MAGFQVSTEGRLTQDGFAELMGISANFLSMIERGINSPSFDKLETISSRLNMTISELFDFPSQPGTRKRAKKPRMRTRSLPKATTDAPVQYQTKKK